MMASNCNITLLGTWNTPCPYLFIFSNNNNLYSKCLVTGLAKGPPKFIWVWENIILVYLAVSDKALDPVALLTLEANLILKPKSQAHSEKKKVF